MTRLGVLGRGDQGGLAAQSLDVARHLRPDVALVVDLGPRGRGVTNLDGWASIGVGELAVTDPANPMNGLPTDDDVRWLVDRCDVLYTPECTYHHGLPQYAAERGCRLLVHANPELWDLAYYGPTTTACNPTTWRHDLLPAGSVHLPMPTQVAKPDTVTVGAAGLPCRTFLHVTQPAMYDRAGTRAVLEALPLVQPPVTLYVTGPNRGLFPDQVGDVTVVKRDDVPNRWRIYDDVDCLLAPRRYGGLSLLMLEAAALTLPVVTTNVEPQASWFGLPGVAVSGSEPLATRGGVIDVYQVDGPTVAGAVNVLATDGDQVRARALDARRWAESMSWENRLPEWRTMIDGGTP